LFDLDSYTCANNLNKMKKLLFSIASLLAAGSLFANNIVVSNVSLSGRDQTNDFTLVNADVAWNNSWRTSTNESNWDGAWVFVKYRKVRTSVWNHATINYAAAGAAASGHTEPAGATIKTSADGKGVFLYRSANGVGNVNFTGAKIRWNYGIDGVKDNDSVEVRVFAMEMVYVPTGSFYLGSGGSENMPFKDGNTTNPFLVADANEISVENVPGSLYYGTRLGEDRLGPIPATYPTGYNAFWLMKYEASQQQYADFLNHLDLSKATARNIGLFTGAHPNFVAPNPERVCGSVSYADLLAYADWTGTRPYTELEYEKACRGSNVTPIANEFAWGNTTMVNVTTVSSTGTANETPIAFANCNHAASGAALKRTGLFATANASRDTAGATYYGIMEMTGSTWEMVVPVSNPTARNFLASKHGSGNLDANGDSPTWNAVGNAIYSLRGGSINNASGFGMVSDAYYRNYGAYYGYLATRNGGYGIRVARTGN
jgi:formylglycine-generating enzyme required for sulfatase activity